MIVACFFQWIDSVFVWVWVVGVNAGCVSLVLMFWCCAFLVSRFRWMFGLLRCLGIRVC